MRASPNPGRRPGPIPIRRAGSADLFRTACALLFLLSLLSGCDDIFEQDIDRARIEVVAPKHDAHIEAGEVTFLWRPLSGPAAIGSRSSRRASPALRAYGPTRHCAPIPSMRPTASR